MASQSKVLLVDDSTTARALTRHMLTMRGHEVVEAEDGESALAILKAHMGVDVVFCDMHMPHMNGIDFLEAAGKLIDLEQVAVFMLTLDGDRNLLERARALGARGFLTKPLKKEHLEAVSLRFRSGLS